MILNLSIDILEEFVKGKDRKIYGWLLAKKMKKNQKTIANNLNKLEKKHILKFRTEGKNKYYFLNFDSPYIKEVVKIVEINKKIRFLENNPGLISLVRELERNTEGILAVFGSYASGKSSTDSDLDLFLIGKIRNIDLIKESSGIKLSIIKSDQKKFDLENSFIKEVMENHIVLKGVEGFAELWCQ